MPTLDFKGKQHIYAHHLTVPHRPLIPHKDKSIANPARISAANATPATPHSPADNLIIHGDNLHALKSLIPRYASRVNCIYIDPPYNTGSQAWSYNDSVNSPLMREWLKAIGPVDNEDLERHDKWLCMMWPRLHLLRELLADNGVIFVSIDDHEQWRLLGLMEEIFGEENFISTLTFIQNLGAYPGKWISQVTEYVHVFAKDSQRVKLSEIPTDEDPTSEWELDDTGYYKEGSELLKRGEGDRREDRPNMYFPVFITTEGQVSLTRLSASDYELLPIRSDGVEGRWMWSKGHFANNLTEIIAKPRSGDGFSLVRKIRPSIGNQFTKKPRSLWYKPQYSTPTGTNTLKTIFDGERVFDFPKAVAFVADLLRFAGVGANKDAIILDSFAGSGTTAHAVLALNNEDGGNRKFMLVECEDYADSITAERVRRVINGVPNARDQSLQNGLGGAFTYYTLGDPIGAEQMLTGERLPDYPTLAASLLYATSGTPAGAAELAPRNEDGRFYADDNNIYHLLYEPNIDRLCDPDLMLNETRAERIASAARAQGKRAIVFGPGKYIGQRTLTQMGITFCQLPYEMNRHGG